MPNGFLFLIDLPTVLKLHEKVKVPFLGRVNQHLCWR